MESISGFRLKKMNFFIFLALYSLLNLKMKGFFHG